MTAIKYLPLNTTLVQALRRGGPDAYGRVAERAVSDGQGKPCRHCLDCVPDSHDMLIAAHRPFADLQPYAETGPIFLCADDCAAWSGDGVPPILTTSPDYLLKGYTADERILYGTGKITPANEVADYATALLARDAVAFVDVRSARNNCFLVRIVRAA